MARSTLKLTIDLEGAAFDGFADDEVAMILKAAAARIQRGGLGVGTLTPGASLPLADTNGNRVGTVEIVEEER